MRYSLPAALICMIGASLAASAAQPAWRAVDPAELAERVPVVDKDADAEILSWDVYVDDTGSGPVLDHYVRVKIFTERGKEAKGRVDLPYVDGTTLEAVSGRTVKPDGTIVEVAPEAIFDRTIVKAGGLKLSVKSFALPGVEPGAIVEYRWRARSRERVDHYLRLDFQDDLPIRRVSYHVKPARTSDAEVRAVSFHCEPTVTTEGEDGSFTVSLSNVPAFCEEPRMPPEDQTRPWMLLSYTSSMTPRGESFWREYGRAFYEITQPLLKANGKVKRAASEAVGDATTPDEKLARLFEFCRTKIRNLDDDTSRPVGDRKPKENKSPADTLGRGVGTPEDITGLFAALATAAGFEARLAVLGDRSEFFFDTKVGDPYFIRGSVVAVKVGDRWRFFSPSSPYLDYGMLPWQYEGQPALVVDPNVPVWVKTPISGPEKSVVKRTARFRLDADGTLEGDVRGEFTGHIGAESSALEAGASAAEREAALRDRVKERLGAGEVSDVRIEIAGDRSKPAYVYSYHVRVPGYAQRTGTRLFLKPNYFQFGVAAPFPSSARTHPVYFQYPWSELDEVTIELPQGFALDNAEGPAPARADNVISYDSKLFLKGESTLLLQREFSFGAGGVILFPVSSYSQLKAAFDRFQQKDSHTITLKRIETGN